MTATLEQQLGPARWHVVPSPPAGDGMAEEEEPCSWRTRELRQFEVSVEAALRDEEDDAAAPGGAAVDRHADSWANEVGAAEACFGRLKASLMNEIVAPLVEDHLQIQATTQTFAIATPRCQQSCDARLAQSVALELPLVVEELVHLLQRTSRLSEVRGRRQRLLSEQNVRLLADAQAQAKQAGNEKAALAAAGGEDPMDGTMTRLTMARKTIKEKEWELMGQRQQVEKIENEKIRLEARVRDLEVTLQRELRARCQVEQVEVIASGKPSTIEASEGELWQRRQQAAAEERRRAAELEVALRTIEELQQRQGELTPSRREADHDVHAGETREDERATGKMAKAKAVENDEKPIMEKEATPTVSKEVPAPPTLPASLGGTLDGAAAEMVVATAHAGGTGCTSGGDVSVDSQVDSDMPPVAVKSPASCGSPDHLRPSRGGSGGTSDGGESQQQPPQSARVPRTPMRDTSKAEPEAERRLTARTFRAEYPGRPAWAENLGKKMSSWTAASASPLLSKLTVGSA